MNFLAHLALSGDDPDLLVGNFMGDFVKGRIGERFTPGIRRGIELHRRIDSFAGANAHFLRSKRRLEPRFGLYRGVMVDLFYDHFLAFHWGDYREVAFDSFVTSAHGTMLQYEALLPDRLARLLPVIFTDLIPSYREVAGIEGALQRMGRRLARPNPLAEGGGELVRHYGSLRDDFREFFAEAEAFVESVTGGTGIRETGGTGTGG